MITDLENLSTKLQQTYGLVQQSLWMSQANSEALAAHIVLYKVLGINKMTAVECMRELGRRRQLGEEYEYEKFIDDEAGKIPKVQNLNLFSLQSLLNVKQITQLLKPLP